jgi:hypothetical protein
MAAPDRSLGLAGSVVKGRYRIDAVFSVGRAVVVYAAEDLRLRRPIALKVLREEFAADSRFVAAVRDQACTLARLAHVLRGVARVYECDATDDGELFVALEWTEGTAVREVVDACGALAPSTALRVAIRVGEALEALHHEGIVHGRVGPDSVLMAKDGDGVEQVKLVGVELTAAYRTPLGRGVDDAFPLAFLAPEQIERGETTEATDVYALGMLLRELLTGGRAREATGAPTASPLPPGIDGIIATALDADPDRRYPDISVMLNDMWGATTGLAEPDPRARAVKPRASTHRRGRRRRPHSTLRITVAVVTAGIIAVVVWATAFERIVSRLRDRVTPSAVTVVPGERDATPVAVQPFRTGQFDVAGQSSVPGEEASTPPQSGAAKEASTVDGRSAPVVVRQEPVGAPAVGRRSRPAVESGTPPPSRTQAERPARRDRADPDPGDGSAIIDWLLRDQR